MPEIKEHLIVLAKLYLDQGEYGKVRDLMEILEQQKPADKPAIIKEVTPEEVVPIEPGEGIFFSESLLDPNPLPKPEPLQLINELSTAEKIQTTSRKMLSAENLELPEMLEAVTASLTGIEEFSRKDLMSIVEKLYPQLDKYVIGVTRIGGVEAFSKMCFDRLTGRRGYKPEHRIR